MAEQGSTQYGGFWIRLLAYAVDGVILWIAIIGLIIACVFLGTAGAMIAAVVPLLLPLLYFAFMQASARQATFGKALLGLKVGNAGGDRISFLRSFAREISKIVSAIPLMIGFLMAAFTGRKQALHDLMASTLVVREGQSHIVAALAVVIVGYLGPVIFVFVMGIGILAGVMTAMGGSMLGGMMSEQPKEGMKTIPAPKPAPAAPAAATAADVDKLLVPLTGLDKAGTTRAGPAVLELSTFFGSGDPKVWVKVHAPLAVSRATVVITQVADSANQSHYDPKNKFETEFFQGVQLSETRSGTPRMEGLRSVNLTPGTTEPQVQKIDGVLKLVVPVGVKALTFRSADAGKDQAVGAVKVKLVAIKADSVELDIGKSRDNVIQFRGFNAKGEPLPTQSTSWSGTSVTVKFASAVDRAEMDIAAEVAERSYPFTLARSGGAAAPVAAAPAAPKPAASAPVVAAPVAPKPVPQVEKPAAAPAPVKVAAAAPPVEAAPKPKPAPRKRAAAPQPKPMASEASAAAPAPVAPPAPKVVVTPRYGDLVSAVMNRDAAGISELLEFGRWVDKPDRKGITPLMVAVTLGDTASAEVLLKAGADAGKALTIARERRDTAMLSLLQRYGAR